METLNALADCICSMMTRNTLLFSLFSFFSLFYFSGEGWLYSCFGLYQKYLADM